MLHPPFRGRAYTPGMGNTSRRALLAAAGAALVAGCGIGGDGGSWQAPVEHCRTPGELVDFSTVGTGRLLYADGDRPTTMRAAPSFLPLLDSWAEDWASLSGLGAVTVVTSYGAYVDKCNSYHQTGNAFDLTHVAHERGEVSLRHDRWGPGTAAQLRDYWRLTASLHLHFAYTLAYPYNAAHDNHVHVDNSVSGETLSTFDARSGAQLALVQHGCRHVFGHVVETTGRYDDQTKTAVRKVQGAAGIRTPLREPDGWRAFCRALAKG